MYRNFQFDTISDAIPSLFEILLGEGREVPSRNGATLELPFTGITLLDSLAREILVPGRKHNLAAQIAETMWVLAGRNDVQWLSAYLPRAKDYSDDGVTWRGGYGRRIRFFSDGNIDQMEHVVNLLRDSPETRQAVISIYDPNIDTEPGKDIPCNDFLHFLSRDGILDLHIFVRSNDMMWGWSGINVFEWSSLLEVVAGMVGMEVGALHFSVSSFHLYEQHWEKAQTISSNAIEMRFGVSPSPRFNATGLDDMDSFHELCHQWFMVEAAIRGEAAYGPLSTDVDSMIEEFPEPMMQSWLRVLAWWWTGNGEYLRPLSGTALYGSAMVAVQPVKREELATVPEEKPLVEQVIDLHNEKDAAYGDSWCRRGEMLGIMANIARKVDRLGSLDTRDETSVDTAMDLFVYLAKYRAWIDGEGRDCANALMRTVDQQSAIEDPESSTEGRQDWLEATLREQFEQLEQCVMNKDIIGREVVIASMLANAWDLVTTLSAK